MRNRAAERNAKFKQTRVQTDGGRKTSFTKAEKARIKAAGYKVEGYSKAALRENVPTFREAAANRKKSLDRNLKNFDAKSYLNRYSDLKAAFGTDEAAARRHYIKYGFDENRDISKFTPKPAPTTVPAGSFNISAAGKLQAEANKQAAAQQKKTYETNRLKAGAKFADDRVQKQLSAITTPVKNTVKTIGDVNNFAKSIGIDTNKERMTIAKAFAKDLGKFTKYAFDKDIAGKDIKQLAGGFADFVTRDKYDIDKLGKESALSEANKVIKAGIAGINTLRSDDKLKAFAAMNPNDVVTLGTKGYDTLKASETVQQAGQIFGLPSNFKDQIDQSKEGLQKNYLDKIKIGDRDSTYQAVSDLARDIGTDPNLGFVSRLAKQYEYNNPYATHADKFKAAFDISNPRIDGLNRDQRGLIEGALGNRILSGKVTDIARESMEGLPTGQMFDANTLAAFTQNLADNFTDPDSVASERGSEIKKLVDPKTGDGINITIPSIIQSNPLSRGGSNLNTTSSTPINTGSGNNTGLTIGGVDTEDTGTTGGQVFTGETVGGTETGIVGGGTDTGGTNTGDTTTGGTNTGDTGGSGSTDTGSTGIPDSGNVSSYDDNTITNIPGTNYDINEALRGLRFDDPDYRARLRRRRRNLLGFRGTFRRPSRMTIAA